MAVHITTELFDVTDASPFSQATPLGAEQFDADRSADVRVELPLDRLKSGPYLLSVTATLPGGRKARRDLVFRVR